MYAAAFPLRTVGCCAYGGRIKKGGKITVKTDRLHHLCCVEHGQRCALNVRVLDCVVIPKCKSKGIAYALLLLAQLRI